MPQRQLTGSRIRARRLDMGVRQADLAVQAGISPSYLNLIEHNRRRIAGKLLHDLARVLNVDPASLAEGTDQAVMAGLGDAAAHTPGLAEAENAEQFAARFPGWADLVVAQTSEIATLRARVQNLADRLAHDPALATALHAVISAVTSIRATSAILVGADKVDADWQQRFHRNIHDDSQRLTDSSRALIGYLEAPPEAAIAPLDPLDAALRVLASAGWHLPLLEAGGRVGQQQAALGEINEAGAQVLAALLEIYRADAQLMPLDAVLDCGRRLGWEPAAMAAALGAPLAAILRRLATLPTDAAAPVVGLVVVDAAGVLRFQRPVAGISLPTAGACPLWPVYQALGMPGQPIRRDLVLPGGQRLRGFAVTEPAGPASFEMPPLIRAVMLLVADPDPGPNPADPLPVGTGCRVCPRSDCRGRREPSILAA